MASSYKLYYFDITGIAEPIRFLLNYGNIDFEDVRIKHENWPPLKSQMPFGHLPVLEHDGKKACQNVAIARYVAKQMKLTGDDEWEDLELDGIVDTINDLRMKLFLHHLEKDEAKKESLRQSTYDEDLPLYLGRLEERANKNNGYLSGGRLTWADIYFVALFDAIERFLQSDFLGTYPALKALSEKILAIPSIKNYVDNRS